MRPLTVDEKTIIKKKEKRMGRKLPATAVEYRAAFPRTTVCFLKKPSAGYRSVGPVGNIAVGIAMRAKDEEDIPANGEVIAFVRALNSL